jgi:tartrate dehydratase alpha subunit/fumarate hydratase class I-like protein
MKIRMDLKQNIKQAVAAISTTMRQRVMQNVQKCLREYVDKNGSDLRDIT